jgi:hypothetical protein
MFTNDIPGAALRVRANQAAPHEGLGEAVHKTPCLIKAIYDFSVQGGAVGNIKLLDDAGNAAYLPTGAVVNRVTAYVVTAVTSGGSATVAATLLSSGDLMVATAKASLGIGVFVDGVPVGTAATMKGPVVAGGLGTQLSIDVAVAALTAGKIQFFIHYIII